MQKFWSRDEWGYCVKCFSSTRSFEDGYAAFRKLYPRRSKKSIYNKMLREVGGITATAFRSLRSKKSGEKDIGFIRLRGKKQNKGKEPKESKEKEVAINKKEIILELKEIYRILKTPFNTEQYDDLSGIPSSEVIKKYGSWNKALADAGLSKKFEAHREVHDEKASFDPDKALKKNWEDEKEKLLERAEQRRVKQIKEQAHKLDLVRDMLDEAVAKVEPLIVEYTPMKNTASKAKKPHCVLWFEFSDLQLGTLITSEEMGGLTHHNWLVWQEKLNIWKKEVIRLIQQYRNTHIIDRVVIGALGDFLESMDIFKGQKWQIDRHVIDQALDGANDTAGAFAEIFLTLPDIEFHVLEVYGNHGRIGDKGANPYSCSLDKVYLRLLEFQIGATKNIKNVTYHHNDCWWYLVEIYGWNHLLLHGDQGMSGLWSSRPTVNSLEKGIARYNSVLEAQINFVHIGHFHQDWQLSFNNSQLLINGSFIGTSVFSLSKMVSGSQPVQVMHVFEPRVGLATTERIFLGTTVARSPVTPKTLSKSTATI